MVKKIACFGPEEITKFVEEVVKTIESEKTFVVIHFCNKDALLKRLSELDLVIFYGEEPDYIPWIATNIENFPNILYIWISEKPEFRHSKFTMLKSLYNWETLKERIEALTS